MQFTFKNSISFSISLYEFPRMERSIFLVKLSHQNDRWMKKEKSVLLHIPKFTHTCKQRQWHWKWCDITAAQNWVRRFWLLTCFKYFAELDLGHLSCHTYSGNYRIILFSIFKTLLFKYGKWPSFIKTQVNGFPDTYPEFVIIRTSPDIWSPSGYLSGHGWLMTSHGQPPNELEVTEPWPISQSLCQ